MDRHSAADPSPPRAREPWWRDLRLLRGLGMLILLAVVAFMIHLGHVPSSKSDSPSFGGEASHESR